MQILYLMVLFYIILSLVHVFISLVVITNHGWQGSVFYFFFSS